MHDGINDWIASHLIIESYSPLSGKSENALWVVLTDRAALVLWTCVKHDNMIMKGILSNTIGSAINK